MFPTKDTSDYFTTTEQALSMKYYNIDSFFCQQILKKEYFFMAFDNLTHAKKLLNVECILSYSMTLAKGIGKAENLFNDEQKVEYEDMCRGAFNLMAMALDRAYDDISTAGMDFTYSYGLSYPLPDKINVEAGETA